MQKLNQVNAGGQKPNLNQGGPYGLGVNIAQPMNQIPQYAHGANQM